MNRSIIIASIILLMTLNFSAHAAVSLGTDTNCDFLLSDFSLQDIIDSGETNIKITNQSMINENISITNTLTLIGGFIDCNEANNQAYGTGSNAVISGRFADTVIKINAPQDSAFIALVNLDISNGVSTSPWYGGGIDIVDSNDSGVQVNLQDSNIRNNSGLFGGGIKISGDKASLTASGSLILSNIATYNGGGINCSGSKIRLFEGSGVTLNRATSTSAAFGKGGGIFATNSCDIEIRSGSTGAAFDYRGIQYNSAASDGGGIYAIDDSEIKLLAKNDGLPSNINNNVADSNQDGSGDGGGIYLSGLGSKFNANGFSVVKNSAENGGGISALDEATVIMYVDPTACEDNNICSEISDNQAAQESGLGGAIYLNNADANLYYVYLGYNRAHAGTVAHIENSSSLFVIRSTLFKNGDSGNDNWDDDYVIHATQNSAFSIFNSTLAHNKATSATLGVSDNSTINVNSSIVFEPETNQTASAVGADAIFTCSFLHNDYGVDNDSLTSFENPQFIDPANDNYHLSAQSPAIDYCAPFFVRASGVDYSLAGGDYDIDGDLGNFDSSNHDNIHGATDAGSDEWYPSSDMIFSHGFEQ